MIETSGEGGLRFRDMSQPETRLDYPELPGQQTIVQKPIDLGFNQMSLNLEGVPAADGTYTLRLSVWARHSGDLFAAQELHGVPAAGCAATSPSPPTRRAAPRSTTSATPKPAARSWFTILSGRSGPAPGRCTPSPTGSYGSQRSS